MSAVQFPTVDGTEAGQWCPTGNGDGTHIPFVDHAAIAERKAQYAACYDECIASQYHPKMLAAVIKEGGKKGVEISGAADMGGLDFFNTQLEQCKGKVNLLEMAMHAMNKDIDPLEEESKGGSAATGKLLLSAGDTEMAVVAYVPNDKQSKVSAVDWVNAILAAWGGGKIEKSSPGWCTASKVADADKGEFTLKLKESGLQTGINFLREKGCFPDGDDSSDDECYGGDFEW